MNNKTSSKTSNKNTFGSSFLSAFSNELEDDRRGGEVRDDKISSNTGTPNISELDRLLKESFSAGGQQKLKIGDKVRAELVAIAEEEIFFSVRTGGAAKPRDGSLPRKELLGDDGTLKNKIGDQLDLYVIKANSAVISLSTSPSARAQAEDLVEAYKMSLPIEGKITETCNGGVRVSIQGKSAFCPISQIDLARVESDDVANFVGQKFSFLITELSEGGRNIVVSRRRLLQTQRSLLEKAFIEGNHEGEVTKGKVTRIEPYGAFVELASGVEGLLHVSEISWSRINDPHEVLSLGQEVTVKILKSESKENRLRISLSIKQALPEPWSIVAVNFKEGQTVEGKVTRCVKFGAFVEIASGLEGLVPLSEMSYSKRVVRSDELIKEGERVMVMIKEIDNEGKRILLSVRDAGGDPWDLVPQKYTVSTVVTGKVTRREPYGIFVELEEGITGLLPKSVATGMAGPSAAATAADAGAANSAGVEHIEFSYDKLKINDNVSVEIASVDLENRRIGLKPPRDPNQDEWKNHEAVIGSNSNNSGRGQTAKLADKFKVGANAVKLRKK
ncbi:MAG: S1 RNA-binding domain-containing protein [Oligoflexia bacterium]|nr:S1 RNA-binding domain-containing protein [Oligoflexia bacterium]